MKLSERTGGKLYRDWAASLSEEGKKVELDRILGLVENCGFLRQSEFYNEDKFGGDIIVVDFDKLVFEEGSSEVRVTGDAGLVISDYPSVKNLFIPFLTDDSDEVVEYGCLKGRKVRFVFDLMEIIIGVDYFIDEDITGCFYLSQSKNKPFKFSKMFEFALNGTELKIDFIEESSGYMILANTSQTFENVLVKDLRKIKECMRKFLADDNSKYWGIFEDKGYLIFSSISISLELLFCQYCCTLNRGCGFEELTRGKMFKEEVYDFTFTSDMEYEQLDTYKGDFLDMGISPIFSNFEYLTLVSKIAQLGSEVVVPRRSILDFEDFKDYFFYIGSDNDSDSYYLKNDKLDEFTEVIDYISSTVCEIHKRGGYGTNFIENLYFCYVWNSLYFDIHKVWSKIRVIGENCVGYDIEYSDVYNTLELTHVLDGKIMNIDSEGAVVFRCDTDLSDTKLRTYMSNSILNSLRYNVKTTHQEDALCGFVNRYKSLVGEVDIYDKESLQDSFKLAMSDIEIRSRLEILMSKHYSISELFGLTRLNDRDRKLSIQASIIEDYSWVLVNYIIICTLMCEKEKLKQVLSEMRSEEDVEGNNDVVRDIDEVSGELFQKKGNVYIFNNVKTKKVDKLLGIHLRKKRAKCKYTTPFWVRSGYFRKGKDGERIWIPEQICRRSPELLSVDVSDSSKIYKATDLFR